MGKYTAETAPDWARSAIHVLSQLLSSSEALLYGLAVAPPRAEMGDLALPLFQFSKTLRTAPAELAKRLVAEAPVSEFFTLQAEGPYVNVWAHREALLAQTLQTIFTQRERYGHQASDPQKIAVIDYSSPNIAKPFAFHHLRTTIIGHALVQILKAGGYTVHGVNHLGDWGTQFGYLIAAHEQDSDAQLAQLTLEDWVKTYVSERARAKSDQTVDERAREAFMRLERGDASAQRIWRVAREVSLRRLKAVYALLGVHFEDDMFIGESFYEPMLPGVIEACVKKGIATESNGALIVDLSEQGTETPLLLQKSDGATLYATRDLAAAQYRYQTFGGGAADWRSLYVVDQGQSLHFEQVFKTLRRLGHDWADRLTHIPFGVLLMWSDEEQGWSKGKTRSGQVMLLENVLQTVTERVQAIIQEKNPELDNQAAIAQAVGIGAVIFNDLKNRRSHDVKFKLEDALSLEGETGPYVHNALVRTKGIMRKAKAMALLPDILTWDPGAAALLHHPREHALAFILASYPGTILEALQSYEPSLIARYLLDLSAAFHAFHHDCLVLDQANPALTHARLLLTQSVMWVIENAMRLIGLKPIEAM